MTYSVNLNEYTVIKKNGSEEQFDINKVVEACRMAASNCSKKLSLSDENGVASIVTSKVLGLKKKSISTEKIHGWAIQALKIIDQEVADCYKSYHQFRKNTMREVAKIKEKSDHLKYAGDRENANYNSSLFSTQNAIFRGWNSTLISKNFFLTKKERQAIKDGFIYIHDLRDIMVGNHNCCVFDMETVLDGGFKILNVRTEEPKRVMSACGAMYDILNTASAQQYGGFSVPEIDKIVAKYAIKEFQHTGDKDGVLENIKQGLQSLQHHINSNVSARGDTPFITFSFGCIDGEDELFNEFQLAACLELLRYRQKVEMTFPKLVCLYSTPIMEKYPILLDECIETNRTTLYPDYVSLDEGYSGELYKKYKLCHTPMGCRSFPTPLGGYENPQKTVGLFNVGVVSLNLPLIYMECSKKKLDFIEEVKKYTQMCIDFLDRRYEQIASMKCSSNPLGFCEGGFVGGNKNPDDLVGDIVNNMGASIGITALNELSVLRNGCELYLCDEEDYRKIIEVVEAIKELVNKNCSNERHYSLYGTPAESLCFSGDTIVQVYGGNKCIKDIKVGDLVYSYNESENKIELKPVIRSMMTSEKAVVVNVKFNNGQTVVCTPNHPFAMRKIERNSKGQIVREYIEYVEAKDLKNGDRIKSNYRHVTHNGRCIFTTNQYEHDVVAEYFYGEKPEGHVVHHKDENKMNNLVENLVYITDAEHRRIHMKDTIGKFCYTPKSQTGKNNTFYGKSHSNESKELNRQSHIGKNNVSSKPLVKLDLDGNILAEYESAGQLYREDKNFTNISYALNGKSNLTSYPQYCGHYHKGSLWYFKSDIENVSFENHIVESVEFLDEEIPVYDITVEDNHNFYVGGDDGILVHNCGTQCEQFRKRFGIVEGVSDKPYFNNSFHMPVTADISPIEKMNLEYELFHIINGGHIQYVRVDEPENKQAIKKLVKYGMKKGFYQGININCISCEDCGEHFRKHPTVCPKCGSKNILEVGRVCGYKGFMNRMNDAKLAEIAERKCM